VIPYNPKGGQMIDADVHNSWASVDELLPYLDPFFQDFLRRGEVPGGQRGAFPAGYRAWLHPEGAIRQDAIPSNHATPGSDYELMCDQLLDRYQIEFAILTGGESWEVSTLANVHYASALARATNDWMIDTWLCRDSRFKGSLFVAPQDPAEAAKEIRRIGSHPDMVQVLVSSHSQRPYGDPFYHPIWEAAAEMDLPVAAHFGGTSGINTHVCACGTPTYYVEFHALGCQAGMSHVASLICQGVFEKFPDLQFVLVELGVTWLPSILWRLDANYKALRKEIPWVRKLPSEYAWEHIWLTTQPLEQPAKLESLWCVLEAMNGKDMLLFSSDYPHWDFDDPRSLRLPDAWKASVFDGNARKLYGLPARQEDETTAPLANKRV
jgi:predicted TIM-barrel fold metal-dependent hydrolase